MGSPCSFLWLTTTAYALRNVAGPSGYTGGDEGAMQEIARLERKVKGLEAELDATEQDAEEQGSRLKAAEQTLKVSEGGGVCARARACVRACARVCVLDCPLSFCPC